MKDNINLNQKVTDDVTEFSNLYAQASNPLSSRVNNSASALSNYTKTQSKPKYDSDIAEIIEIVRILNNMAPIRMPEYNFNTDEINGDVYFRPSGDKLLIREYDGDLIRDYYYSTKDTTNKTIGYILEHDKNTGILRTKIEPITRAGSRLKTNITIFDAKINNKYTIMQLSEGGIVNNISEFSGKGKSFKTLFRNINTFKPVRYLEGRDSKQGSFEMIDCLFNFDGEVVRIKRYNNNREISINYTDDTKSVTVKNK